MDGYKAESAYFATLSPDNTMKNSNKTVVAEKLLQAAAIRLSPDKPFTWASGWKSPIYCDNRTVLGQPYIREFIKSEMCSVAFESFADAELIAGVATAGIAWGALAADQLKLPFVYVRPKPKEHGMGNQIEGSFQPGAKVLVIEDLVSTGGSSLKAVEALQRAGLEVVGLLAIFTYSFAVAEQAFAKANIPFMALTDYPALIELAVANGIVPAKDYDLLQAWRQSPDTWAQ